MKQLINEFKTFILKGNVMELAVGIIIGGAFGTIVSSLVKDIITPIIGVIGGKPDFSGIAIGGHKVIKDGKEILEGGIMIGNFINAVIGFLIIAAVIFFIFVKPMNRLIALAKRKEAEKPVVPPPVPEDVKLLTEIRDLLKK